MEFDWVRLGSNQSLLNAMDQPVIEFVGRWLEGSPNPGQEMKALGLVLGTISEAARRGATLPTEFEAMESGLRQSQELVAAEFGAQVVEPSLAIVPVSSTPAVMPVATSSQPASKRAAATALAIVPTATPAKGRKKKPAVIVAPPAPGSLRAKMEDRKVSVPKAALWFGWGEAVPPIQPDLRLIDDHLEPVVFPIGPHPWWP